MSTNSLICYTESLMWTIEIKCYLLLLPGFNKAINHSKSVDCTHIQHSNVILVNECISVMGRNSFLVNMQTEIENAHTHTQIH